MPDSDYPKLRSVEFVPTNVDGKVGLVVRDPYLYSDKILFIPREVVAVIQFFDGTKTFRQIQQEILDRSGSLIDTEDIKKLAGELDSSHYLVSESFLKHKRQIDEEFFRSPVRYPVHSGAGYSADPQKLREDFASYFARIADAPDTSVFARDSLSAVMAPHISIGSGGTCFAHAYDVVRKAGPADLYVILGVGHAGIEHLFAGTAKDFATPLGVVKTDRRFMTDLDDRFGGRLFAGETIHRTEHTVEFQTVFLKYLFGDADFTIAPILASFPHTIFMHDRFSAVRQQADEFIAALRETLARFNGRAVLIASVDFAHVGVKYGDEQPPTPADIDEVRERDRRMIEIIGAGDIQGFLEHIASDDDKRRICGFPAIYTMLSVLGDARGSLLHYDSTVMDDTNSTVTFAGMAFGGAGVRRA